MVKVNKNEKIHRLKIINFGFSSVVLLYLNIGFENILGHFLNKNPTIRMYIKAQLTEIYTETYTYTIDIDENIIN